MFGSYTLNTAISRRFNEKAAASFFGQPLIKSPTDVPKRKPSQLANFVVVNSLIASVKEKGTHDSNLAAKVGEAK